MEEGRLSVGPGPRLSGTAVVSGPPATLPGIDGQQIVNELGLESQWAELVDKGVVVAPS